MERSEQPARRPSRLRLLAAALAGALGTFGVPAGAQAHPPTPTLKTPPPAAAAEATRD